MRRLKNPSNFTTNLYAKEYRADTRGYWPKVAEHPNVTCSYSVFTDLVDLFLSGFQRLNDAVQLDTTREQALLQLGLLLLQPAQLRLGAAQFVLLALKVGLLRADLALQGRDLASESRKNGLYFYTYQLCNSSIVVATAVYQM